MADLDETTLFGDTIEADVVPWPHGYGSLTPASFTQCWPEGYGAPVNWPMFTADGGRFQRLTGLRWPEGYGPT